MSASPHIWSYLSPDCSEAEGDASDPAVPGLQPGGRAHLIGHHVPLLPHPQVTHVSRVMLHVSRNTCDQTADQSVVHLCPISLNPFSVPLDPFLLV